MKPVKLWRKRAYVSYQMWISGKWSHEKKTGELIRHNIFVQTAMNLSSLSKNCLKMVN
jgi:hypothetical protein